MNQYGIGILIVMLGVFFIVFFSIDKLSTLKSWCFLIISGIITYLILTVALPGDYLRIKLPKSSERTDGKVEYKNEDNSLNEINKQKLADLTLEWMKIEEQIQEYSDNVTYKINAQSGDYGVSDMYQIKMLIVNLTPLAKNISQLDPEFGQECLDRIENYRKAYNEVIRRSFQLQMAGVSMI